MVDDEDCEDGRQIASEGLAEWPTTTLLDFALVHSPLLLPPPPPLAARRMPHNAGRRR